MEQGFTLEAQSGVTLSLDELIRFSVNNSPENLWPQDMIKRFLTELISSRDFIIGIYKKNELVALAVLLDNLKNPSNDACLEVLGVKPDYKNKLVYELIFKKSFKLCPNTHFGVQLTLPKSIKFSSDELNQLDLVHHYDVVEMKNLDPKPTKLNHNRISNATLSDAQVIYRLVCESFKDNIETSIPNFEEWSLNYKQSNSSKYFLYKLDSTPIGFLQLITHSDYMEVNTIGVLKDYRSQGIGSELLKFALNETAKSHKSYCELSVSVHNENALNLYLGLGFIPVNKTSCYRRVNTN